MWHLRGITLLQHAALTTNHTLLSPGGHASKNDDITAGGQYGISFVNPIGEIFLHPLAGTIHFFFLLFIFPSLYFFFPAAPPTAFSFYSFHSGIFHSAGQFLSCDYCFKIVYNALGPSSSLAVKPGEVSVIQFNCTSSVPDTFKPVHFRTSLSA